MEVNKHVVELSDEDCRTLEWFISTGERKVEDNMQARILLKADDELIDSKISEHVGCHWKTAYNTRKAYCERGLVAIHRRKPDREYERNSMGKLKPSYPSCLQRTSGRTLSLDASSLCR
jgi:hypothetical protein